MTMAEPKGKKETSQPGAFKSAFFACSPNSETRLAGLGGLSSKFSQWEKYLQDRHALSEGKEGRISATARRALNIAAAKAEFAEGKLRLETGRGFEKSKDHAKAAGQFDLALSHFSKAEKIREGAGLDYGIESGMKSYAMARYLLSGWHLGIGDIAEILKTTPDGAVRYVKDAVGEEAAETLASAFESLLGAEKNGRGIAKLPVAEIGIAAGNWWKSLEEKDKASEIYVKTGDWCAKKKKYADAAGAYRNAAGVNPLMAKIYLQLAGHMDKMQLVAMRSDSGIG